MSRVEKEAYRLMDLYSAFEDEIGQPYRVPSESIEDNRVRVTEFFYALVDTIKATTNLDKFDQRTWDILEDENFHTLCIAINIARGIDTVENNLERYSR